MLSPRTLAGPCLFALLLAAFVAAMLGQAAVAKEAPKSREQINLSFAPVVREVAPAVVNIYANRVVTRQTRSPLFDDPFFRRFLGEDFPFGGTRKRIERSLGSGVIVRPSGIVVTNHHVIRGAKAIKVVLSDRREFSAKLLISDKRTDISVLKIEEPGLKLPSAQFGDPDAMEVGDLVLAIGNPFGVGQTVTSGIISALARTNVGITDFRSFIQTDAAINPGNSGGALVNMQGKLIGINTAIYSRSGGSLGIGFAVPTTIVRTIVESAVSGKPLRRPWLSFSGRAVTADMASALGLFRPMGVLVEDIYPDGPAAKAGIRRGDVVTEIDGHLIDDEQALRFRLAAKKIGKSVPIKLRRGGKVQTVRLPLMAPPETPPRNETILAGVNPLAGAKVVNISPAVAEEQGLAPNRVGVLVLGVRRGSSAARIGLRRGDVLESINGLTARTVTAVKQSIAVRQPRWQIRVKRGKRLLTIKVG